MDAETLENTVRSAAEELGLDPSVVRPVGRGVRKVPVPLVRSLADRPKRGRLVLVTAMTPTSHGEGKTVTAIGTAMALRAAGHRAAVVLRQPSLGPVFGVKGGASGGGRATIRPEETVNLGLTGDLHAVAAAHNLLSALLGNHLYYGNDRGIDPDRIPWPWTVDMEDRTLRHVVGEAKGPTRSVRREGSFVITAASEVTAILGLARDYADLRERLGRILVGVDRSGAAVRAEDLQASGAMAALLRDALEPNLLAAADGTPALVHGGPFGNLAHGTASRLAIELGLATADYCVVEAGFATELGAEKFVDIVARSAGLNVDAGLVVATVRGLRHQGGVAEADLGRPDPGALGRGLANLEAHLANLRRVRIPAVVVLNRFPEDPPDEIALVRELAEREGVGFTVSTAYADGAAGAASVAEAAVRAAAQGARTVPVYPPSATIEEALRTVATGLYGAQDARFSDRALRELETLERLGETGGPICVAKTALSLSDDPHRLGRPTGFTVEARRLQRSAGAGFTVVSLGPIEAMPGLPRRPRAERIDLLPDGRIVGVA